MLISFGLKGDGMLERSAFLKKALTMVLAVSMASTSLPSQALEYYAPIGA